MVAINPGLKLTYRDVGANVIPHLTQETIAGVRAIAESEAELLTSSLSDELIAELKSADIIVIGAPMYNFSIPSTLRTWFDHVLRPRATFAYSAAGAEGLLKGKRAIVIESRGGMYSDGPMKSIDFQEPYIRQLLKFIGISDVTFIHAEKIGSGPEDRDRAMIAARQHIEDAVGRISSAPAENVDLHLASVSKSSQSDSKA